MIVYAPLGPLREEAAVGHADRHELALHQGEEVHRIQFLLAAVFADRIQRRFE